MKKTKLLISFILVGLGLLALPSFAAELNSGNVTESPLNCYTGATTCLLSNRGITAIASGTFINHTNLETLYLNNNEISSIESGDFTGLGNLEELRLYNNGISSIESGGFSGLVSLQELNLSDNSISSIESGAFTGLGNLQALRLYNNGISSIESGAFSGLGSLELLDLCDNEISSIESGAFSGLGSLELLNLGDNEISSIESGAFSGLGSLETLYLKENSISSIESGGFSGLVSLQELNLSDNSISSIESGAFSGLGSLELLYLDENSISSIESGDFNYLLNLKKLNLRDNSISSIESGAFSGLGSLEILYLSFNSISSIESGYFSGLGSLESLYLYGNRISSIESGAFTPISGVITFEIDNNELCTWTLAQSTLAFIDNKTGGTDWQATQDTTNCPIIDKTPPTAEISYSTTEITNGDVIATITLSETGTVTNNSNELTYTFTGNGSFTFEFEDEAGNTGEKIADVDWIDNTSPEIDGVEEGESCTTSATFSVTDNVAVISVTLDGESLTGRAGITITEIGDHTLIASDAAGNTTTVSFTIKKKSSRGGVGYYYLSPEMSGVAEVEKTEGKQSEEEEAEEAEAEEEVEVVVGGGTRTVKVTKELNEAYEYVKEKGVTTTKDIEEFEPESQLLRMHLAKMISEFAINVMGKEEMTEGVEGCNNFEDMAGETEEMQKYASMACKLGLMGRESDQKTVAKNFNPEIEVNRAQFGTILSRLLRGQRYAIEDGSVYYRDHLEALKKDGILAVIDPEMEELMGWVALMLYRVGLAK